MWKIVGTIMILTAASPVGGWAQDSDSAVFPPHERQLRAERWQESRMDRMVEYLELSESQVAQWQSILESRASAVPDRQEVAENLAAWQEEFRTLANQENPDLEQLGQIALDIHRAHESRRDSRNQLLSDLQTVLTPEQSEKLEALRAAKEFAAPHGRQGRRHRREPLGAN